MRTSFTVKRVKQTRGVLEGRESHASFIHAWYARVEAVWADDENGEPRDYEVACE